MSHSRPCHALKFEAHPVRRVATLVGSLIIGAGLVAAPVAVGSASAQLATGPGVRPAGFQLQAANRLASVAAWAQWGVNNRVPYRFGGGHGSTPSIAGGADCSGFVRWAYYKGFGVDIGSGSADSMIRTSGKFVKVSKPVPGDVVLLGRGGSGPAYHTSIYIGIRNGHPASAAESTTGQPAKIQYWYTGTSARNFMGYWRYRGASTNDLPTTRSASRVGAAVTQGSLAIGQVGTVKISVRTAAGSPIDGARVALYQRNVGGSFRLAAQVTARSGAESVRITGNGVGHQYFVRYAGDTRHGKDDSAVVTQYSRAGVSPTAGLSGTVRAGGVVKTSGVTSAHLAGSKVQLQRVTARGWVPAGGASIVGSDGHFGIYWRAQYSGYYRLAIARSARMLQAASTSAAHAVAVR